jgi:hypothetical protein
MTFLQKNRVRGANDRHYPCVIFTRYLIAMGCSSYPRWHEIGYHLYIGEFVIRWSSVRLWPPAPPFKDLHAIPRRPSSSIVRFEKKGARIHFGCQLKLKTPYSF